MLSTTMAQNAAVSTMFLSREEVDALCAPVTQPAAQLRKLHAMGLSMAFMSMGRKKHVQLYRLAYEAWQNPPPAPPPAAPVRDYPRRVERTYQGSALHRYHIQLREAKAEQDAARAKLPKPTRRELLEREAERQEAIALQKAATVRFHAAKRRTLRLQRTPLWADAEAIRAIYLEAQRLTRDTGVPHHVDHDVPLQGKLVSGLHVHNNLQILTGSENSKKRNRFEIES